MSCHNPRARSRRGPSPASVSSTSSIGLRRRTPRPAPRPATRHHLFLHGSRSEPIGTGRDSAVPRDEDKPPWPLRRAGGHDRVADGEGPQYRRPGDPPARARRRSSGACWGSIRLPCHTAAAHEARASGIRPASPDRSGVGRSDPGPGRTTRDRASDMTEPAEALGIDRFSVHGCSMGGQYALACAAVLRARKERVACASGAVPADARSSLAELNGGDRVLTWPAWRASPMAGGVFAVSRRPPGDGTATAPAARRPAVPRCTRRVPRPAW
ncbi:alpha/beta fold hydrolase [Streptomyces sp. NPDC012637]|uniref:alpha/beta fold hydrolase n=1 Tax=Streptomyces sp. NPDC012637 TaxID=3364842 RepID=UPI0036EEAC1F